MLFYGIQVEVSIASSFSVVVDLVGAVTFGYCILLTCNPLYIGNSVLTGVMAGSSTAGITTTWCEAYRLTTL